MSAFGVNAFFQLGNAVFGISASLYPPISTVESVKIESQRLPWLKPFLDERDIFWTNGHSDGRTGMIAWRRCLGAGKGVMVSERRRLGQILSRSLTNAVFHTLALSASRNAVLTPFQDDRYIFWMNGTFGG